jgi:hypothetical protein
MARRSCGVGWRVRDAGGIAIYALLAFDGRSGGSRPASVSFGVQIMFGWGKKNIDGRQLNARNPQCAKLFHPLFDSYAEKYISEEYFFELPFMQQFAQEYELTKKARKNSSLEQLKKNFLSVSVGLLSSYANDPSNNATLGRGAALTTIGRIIFAHAPGLALNGANEAKEVTWMMIRDLEAAFNWAAPNTYLYGVSQTCSEFLLLLQKSEQGNSSPKG